MGKVLSYLDCGCAITDDGRRTYCPTCSAPRQASGTCAASGCACPAPAVTVDVTRQAEMDESSFLLATAIVEHSADLYELVRAHVKILQRCREARGLTTAEQAFLARGAALVKVIGGAA